MSIGQGSQELSGGDSAEPGQIRGFGRRSTSAGTAPVKNQCLPPFRSAERGETVCDSLLHHASAEVEAIARGRVEVAGSTRQGP